MWTGVSGMSWAHWQLLHVCTPQCQSVWAAGRSFEGDVELCEVTEVRLAGEAVR